MTVPTIDNLKKETKEELIKKKLLSVKIIGCGGGGINLANKLSKFVNKDQVLLIDTSVSNICKENKDFQFLKIDGFDGSGKFRATNYNEINKFISNELFELEGLSDINIIFFSLSGGSGSVIAPLLLSEIKRRNKIAICICISDNESFVDVTNTYNTIQSINDITTKNNIYLPFMLFDNSYNRLVVDQSVVNKVSRLIEILSIDMKEIDNTDIINWLQPNRMFKEISPGIKTIFVDTDVNGTWKKESGEVIDDKFNILDSMLIVSSKDRNISASKKCKVIFKGFNSDYNKTIFVGNIGMEIPNSYFTKLNDKLHEYKSIENTIGKEKITPEYQTFENKTDSGIVL